MSATYRQGEDDAATTVHNLARPDNVWIPERAAHLARVEEYYEETWSDYRAVWMNHENRALHFGYRDAKGRTHARSLNRMNEVMAELGRISRGDRIFDAGCGVGGAAMWLAETLDAYVVGTTASLEQALRARQYARRRQLAHRTRFEAGDFLHTGLEAGTFDVVWSQEAVCHEPDKVAFFTEALRLLRPGGRIVIEDWFATDGPQGPPRWIDGMGVAPLVTIQQFTNTARECGFAEPSAIDVGPRVAPSLRRLCAIAVLFTPVMAVRYRRGGRSKIQQANIRAAVHQYPSFRRGQWTVGIVTATKPAATGGGGADDPVGQAQ